MRSALRCTRARRAALRGKVIRAPVGLDGGTSPCVKCDGGCNGRGACAAASAGSAAAAVGDGVCVCEGPFGGAL